MAPCPNGEYGGSLLSSAPRCRSHARCWKRSAPATCRGILVLNKIDKVAQTEREELSEDWPRCWCQAEDSADVQRVPGRGA